jgi:hypothetical protein
LGWTWLAHLAGRYRKESRWNAAPSQIAASSQPERSVPRQGSKLAEVMALLGRKQRAGIEELTSATGWLPHTTRAALTGLRKRGYAIERSRSGAGRLGLSDRDERGAGSGGLRR